MTIHIPKARLSRRTVLRGLGAALALPTLEAMAPSPFTGRSSAASLTKPPLRFGVFYVPNGVHMPDWTPTTTGPNFALPQTLQDLKPVREQVSILSGLTLNNARSLGDGAGDHARSASAFLTGAHPHKTNGADIRVGISVDQLIAQHIGAQTKLPSIELGCERGAQSGSCDSGYSCAYSSNLSWRTESTPVAKEISPRLAFERLFSSGDSQENARGRERRNRYNQSVLDLVRDDAKSLQRQLGRNDHRKLDEYLTAVREVERLIARVDGTIDVELPENAAIPSAKPRDYAEHIRSLQDLMILAYQTDSTRVATFMYANEGSNRSYRNIDIDEGHHALSHHGRRAEKQDKLSRINSFHMSFFAETLVRMAEIEEADGTRLLDHMVLLYGSGIGDGDRHNHDDLPILLAGGGSGTIVHGQHRQYADETPLTNLYLEILDRFAVPVDSFGDSTGRLANLMS